MLLRDDAAVRASIAPRNRVPSGRPGCAATSGTHSLASAQAPRASQTARLNWIRKGAMSRGAAAPPCDGPPRKHGGSTSKQVAANSSVRLGRRLANRHLKSNSPSTQRRLPGQERTRYAHIEFFALGPEPTFGSKSRIPSFGRNADSKSGIIQGGTRALEALGTDDIVF
jgi:hypothetical protein